MVAVNNKMEYCWCTLYCNYTELAWWAAFIKLHKLSKLEFCQI